MTVYPFFIHFGSFTITGFGIMMVAAFLVGGWVFARETERAGLDPAIAWDSVVAAVLGGLIGAKIYYAALVGRWDALVSRGGLVWYGGFAGGTLAVMGYWWWKKHGARHLLDLISPAMAVGYLLGRVGCFLVGDDYGVPSSLPWAMKFPQGSPPSTANMLTRVFGVDVPPGTPADAVLAVHPTQLYEVALMFAVFLVLWRVRAHRHRAGWLFGLYLTLAGAERLVVEFFRAKDDRLLGPLTLAQAFSLVVVAVGAWLLTSSRVPATPASSAPEA